MYYKTVFHVLMEYFMLFSIEMKLAVRVSKYLFSLVMVVHLDYLV